MPTISVIVPVYNVEKYLVRCINSVLAQTFTDFELIIVDDGSPDNCGENCDKYVELDSRIIVLHQHNGGLSDARNVGMDWSIKCCTSEWITFIDSDDWVHSLYLQELYNAVMETDCQISISNYKQIVEEDYFENPFLPDLKKVEVESFYCDNNINAVIACGKLYKKHLFNDVRFPSGKIHEDEFTTYKLLFKDDFIAFQAFPLYYYYFNNNSITANWSPKRLDSIKALRNQIVFFQDNGYKRAYNKSIINAAMNILKNYIQLNETEYINGKEKYKKVLSSELKSIFRYTGAKEILPFTHYRYLYEIAYPKLMKYYWYLQSIKSKIKKC